MPIDAASHFSGKRKTERIAVDLPVELRGGGIVVQGRAVDLSQHGIRVELAESAIEGLGDVSGAFGSMGIIDRHFASGVEVRFPAAKAGASGSAALQCPAHLARLSVPPRSGPELWVSCEFDRPLSAAQWETLIGSPLPKKPGASSS